MLIKKTSSPFVINESFFLDLMKGFSVSKFHISLPSLIEKHLMVLFKSTIINLSLDIFMFELKPALLSIDFISLPLFKSISLSNILNDFNAASHQNKSNFNNRYRNTPGKFRNQFLQANGQIQIPQGYSPQLLQSLVFLPDHQGFIQNIPLPQLSHMPTLCNRCNLYHYGRCMNNQYRNYHN